MKRDRPFDGGRREWIVRRNCSLSPRQTAGAWAVLLALSLVVGITCAWHGAWYVLVFSALEISVVTVAFALYSRHAGDCDRIVYENGCLFVEQVRAGRVLFVQLDPHWLRVVPPRRRHDPVRLEARGISVSIGSWLPDAGRRALARELREELAR